MLKIKGWLEGWTSNERLEVTSLHLSRSSTKPNRRVPEKDVEIQEALMLLHPASPHWKTRYYVATLEPWVTEQELLPRKTERKKNNLEETKEAGSRSLGASVNQNFERQSSL